MKFITLNTGHSCEWPMNRLTPAARTHCTRWLKASVRQSGPTAVPELGLSAKIRLTRHPDANTADSVMIILDCAGLAVIVYTLCIHAVRAAENWGAVVAMAGKFGVRSLATRPEDVPWLLAILMPPAELIDPNTLAMCADFAACIATVFLEKEARGEITP